MSTSGFRFVRYLLIFILALSIFTIPVISKAQGTTFTVTTTNDSGAGSLRQAILDANSTVGKDTINFSLAGTLPTISLLSPLPSLTDSAGTIIDALPTAESACTAYVIISGTSASVSYGLMLDSVGNIIQGLNIQDFQQTGIHISSTSSANLLYCNIIERNGSTGLRIEGASNFIGEDVPLKRNVIKNNPTYNVLITGMAAQENVIQYNQIGDLPNAIGAQNAIGVQIEAGATLNIIGSNGDQTDDPSEGNIIIGNATAGVILTDSTTHSNRVAANSIGYLTSLQPNGIGVLLKSGTHDNIVGSFQDPGYPSQAGNIIVGSVGYGVKLTDAGTNNNRVSGNLIGIIRSPVSNVSYANTGGGVEIINGAQNNIIGSDNDAVGDNGERNIIAGNAGSGVHISGASSTGNQIMLNVIGIAPNGSGKANGKGIYIEAPNATLSTVIFGNIIGSSNQEGILLSGAHGNTIRRNQIGTNYAGTLALPTSLGALKLSDSRDNVIGGNSASDSNIIAGAGFLNIDDICLGDAMITLTGTGTQNNTIQGNRIGVNGGSTALNCKDVFGILIINSSNNLIGGTTAGTGNTIGFASSGVAINGTAVNNRVLGNSIYGLNNGLAIDLRSDGPTPNDPGDADSGPNGVQNLLEWETIDHTVTTVNSVTAFAHLNSTANTTFRVEFFISTSCQANTLYSEAKQYLSSLEVSTDGTGNVSFSVDLANVPLATNPYLTATVTGPSGTSELSRCTRLNRVVVLNVNDSGPGSFRRAIELTNTLSLLQKIEFAIPGSGVKEITLLSPLPTLTARFQNRVEIQGLTQAGASCHAPKVALIKGYVGSSDGLTITGGYVVEGLIIGGFSDGYGINLQGNANIVSCNFIGTSNDGSSANPNRVGLLSPARDNQIYDNVISGNLEQGMLFQSAITNNVAGNYVGIDATGTFAVPNGQEGIVVSGYDVRIQNNNVISGNLGDGLVFNYSSDTCTVYGSLIGLNAAGTAAIPNQGNGIRVQGVHNLIGDYGRINIIGGNKGNGVLVETTTNIVDGNFIGVNLTGTAAIPNELNGILVTGNSNSIGGYAFNTSQNANIISGNLLDGIVLEGTLNTVEMVRVGSNSPFTAALPNGHNGIRVTGNNNTIQSSSIGGNTLAGIADYASGTLITGNIIGTEPANPVVIPNAAGINFFSPTIPLDVVTEVSGNTIVANVGAGISIPASDRKRVKITANYIHSNGGLSIDLGADGVTLNDSGDSDSGANGLQNYPTLTQVTSSNPNPLMTTTLHIIGSINSTPNTNFTLEFFITRCSSQYSYAAGPLYDAFTVVTTDGAGNASFDMAVVTSATPAGITATARDPQGNTSEISNCVSVSRVPETIGIYRPSTNTFYLRNSNSTGFADLYVSLAGLGMDPNEYRDVPVVGDWNGDGIDTVGFYRRGRVSDGAGAGLFLLSNSNTSPLANYSFILGNPGDTPIVGDWDGDGRDSVGVFRPTNGLIYIKNNLTTGFADYTMVLGNPGDIGIAGDWDNDGKDSPGVYRPGVAPQFYLTNQVCNCIVASDYNVTFGNPGDQPFTGDWNGDGRTGVGVYRTSNGITYLRNDPTTTGFSDFNFVYGINGDYAFGGVWQAVVPPSSEPTPQVEIAPTFQP
ncbi:MAG: right-handed parallel beta-helix repeat-containing protein [Anaerolineae bacterium]|nr:right-handed parallel beta-helix repeat-containing protein [Anaerolineae bacterium]